MVKRIVFHWSAGRYYPTEFEKKFYHFLIDAKVMFITDISNRKIITCVFQGNMPHIRVVETPALSVFVTVECTVTSPRIFVGIFR